jgi:hypothetical protein
MTMPTETATDTDEMTDDTNAETITVTQGSDLTGKQEGIRDITADITVHGVVGDSEFDHAFVRSTLESDDDSLSGISNLFL